MHGVRSKIDCFTFSNSHASICLMRSQCGVLAGYALSDHRWLRQFISVGNGARFSCANRRIRYNCGALGKSE